MEDRFYDPATVNDVETARLALRWSLEKIHGLQDEVNKAKETAEDAVEKLRRATETIAEKDAAILRWKGTRATGELGCWPLGNPHSIRWGTRFSPTTGGSCFHSHLPHADHVAVERLYKKMKRYGIA